VRIFSRASLRTAFSLALGACLPVARPDGGKGLLQVGMMAPDVTGSALDGGPTALSTVHGHAAVVYFYPKDGTSGCTREACAFRDWYEKYESRHVVIFGVSRDSAESHRGFRAKHDLPFLLVADESGSVARAYGVPGAFGMTSRVTFLVGKEGRILRVWPDVDPSVHAEEVLAAIDAADPR
jgi:thioredoxin-dependent peroxiredoxin